MRRADEFQYTSVFLDVYRPGNMVLRSREINHLVASVRPFVCLFACQRLASQVPQAAITLKFPAKGPLPVYGPCLCVCIHMVHIIRGLCG